MVGWIVVCQVDDSLGHEILREAVVAMTIVNAWAFEVGCDTLTVEHQVFEVLALHSYPHSEQLKGQVAVRQPLGCPPVHL